MADEITKADIDAAVKVAVEKTEAKFADKIEELTNKNAGLLEDFKKAQRELRAAKDITPEAHQAEVERADKAEADLAEAQKQLKTATKQAEDATKALEAENGFTSKLLIQDGIKSALLANGVKDEDFIDTLTAKFASNAAVVADGDARKAMIGDKPVADAIKEWAAGDSGKKFVSAPLNGGGGAPGGAGGGENKTMTRARYDEMAITDPAGTRAFIKDGGRVVADA